MDRIDDWRAFLTVARLHSFSGAARTLGRSPQAITRAVAGLEARLGVRLLHRTTRAVSITPEGERYLERGRRALAELDALEARADAGAPLAGRLAVTAPVMFGQLHVLPVVTELLGSHPGLDVRLDLLDRVVSLGDEGIDVAVRIGALPDSALQSRIVGEVRPLLCASPGYLRRAGLPRTVEALSAHACVAFTATTPIPDRWSFPGRGRRARVVAVRPRLVVNTPHAAIAAALAGLGIVRVVSYQVAELVAAGKLRVLLAASERTSIPVQVVHLPGLQTRAATAFVELAAARLRERLRP